MYNANIPSNEELPSSKQLIKSTFLALVVALVLLITCILPAEYGVDPTGIGRSLGLTQMGEIKEQLAEEAAQDEALQSQASTELVVKPRGQDEQSLPSTSAPSTSIASANTQQPETEIAVTESVTSESYQVTLKPGEAAEVKLAMSKSSQVNYIWSVNQGHVNYDTHADNAKVKYHNYNKGKAVKKDEGVMTAAFDGKHGWFWRNRSNQTVTVTLEVSGDYSELVRVL